jgi:hypothetical protein
MKYNMKYISVVFTVVSLLSRNYVSAYMIYQPPRALLGTRINMSDGAWNGQVVSNQGGTIKGCSIQQMDGSTTEWIFTIDGYVTSCVFLLI